MNEKLVDILFGEKLPNELKNLKNREALGKVIDLHLSRTKKKRTELLLTPGNICEQIFVLEKGAARGFYYDEMGEEKTIYLWGDNHLVTDCLSYFRTEPSKMYIQLTQDSVLVSLSRKDLVEMMEQFPYVQTIIDSILESDIEFQRERVGDFMTLNPLARYSKLRKAIPDADQKFSQNQIAEFLGTTRQTIYRCKRG